MLFFFHPLSLFFCVCNTYNEKFSKIFIILFCGYLGYSFHVSPLSDLDANRYIEKFDEYCQGGNQIEIISFFDNLWKDPDHLEITFKLLSYLASFISSDYHVLFALMGLLYGVFLTLNLSQFKNYSDFRFLGKNFVIILLLILPPWLINGFDFWMATQIFIAGFFALLKNKYIKSFFFFAFASVTHWSFLIFIIGYLLLVRIRSERVLIVLFFSSFIIKYFIGTEIIENILSNLQLVNIALKAQVYLDGEVALPGGNIYGLILSCHRLISVLIFLYIFIKFKSDVNSNLRRLLNATIVIITISNLISVVPILGRFISISVYLILFNFAVFFVHNLDLDFRLERRRMLKTLIVNFTLFIILLDFVYNGFLVIGVLSILGNPLISYFVRSFDFVLGNVYGHILNMLNSI